MEKLEIKHLAPYLPYDLKEINYTAKKHGLIETPLIGVVNANNILTFVDGKAEGKILLRPLTDLFKEIEHNGEKFIPIREIFRMQPFVGYAEEYELSDWYIRFYDWHKVKDEENYWQLDFYSGIDDMTGFDNFTFKLTRHDKGESPTVAPILNQLMLFEKLFEWHFDVYGLIGKGLAININEIKL